MTQGSRRKGAGGLVGIVLGTVVLGGMFTAASAPIIDVAEHVAQKVECHVIQMVAGQISARGGQGAQVLANLGEKDVCKSKWQLAQAICRDLTESAVCSPGSLAKKVCGAAKTCTAVTGWFSDIRVAMKAYVADKFKTALSLLKRVPVWPGSGNTAESGVEAAQASDGSAAAASTEGAVADASVITAEGGGLPDALPNDSGLAGVTSAESVDDLAAGADLKGASRSSQVLDVVKGAAGKLGSGVKVVGKVARVGLRVAGWVGLALFVAPILKDLITGYTVSDDTQSAGLHYYDAFDITQQRFTPCDTRYDLQALVLSDPTSHANTELVSAASLNTDFNFTVEGDSPDGKYLAGDGSSGLIPGAQVTLRSIYEHSRLIGGDGANDTGPSFAMCMAQSGGTQPKVAAFQQQIADATARDVRLAGFDDKVVLAAWNNNQDASSTPGCADDSCFDDSGGMFVTVNDITSSLWAQGKWDQATAALSSPPSSSKVKYPTPRAFTEINNDLTSNNYGPWYQLESMAAASSSQGSGRLQAALDAIQSKCGCTIPPKPQQTAPSDNSGATPASDDQNTAMLLAMQDVLSAGDETSVTKAYSKTDSDGTVTDGIGGNLGATRILPSQLVTGYAASGDTAPLDPTDPNQLLEATSARLQSYLVKEHGDLNLAFADYIKDNHLPPYAAGYGGTYSQNPGDAPSDQWSENPGDWGVEMGAYQSKPVSVPTAFELTYVTDQYMLYLTEPSLTDGTATITAPGYVLAGQPQPPADLVPLFEGAAQQYDTSLPLLYAVAAQEHGFNTDPTAACSHDTNAGTTTPNSYGLMQMQPGTFMSNGHAAGLPPDAFVLLPNSGQCPNFGEPSGELVSADEINAAAYMLHAMGGSSSVSLQVLALAAYHYNHGPAANGFSMQDPYVQSVVDVRYPAYLAWVSGGSPTGTGGYTGPIPPGYTCCVTRQPVVLPFPWLPQTVDTNRDDYPYGQCTYWAAAANVNVGAKWGNANQWYGNAQRAGASAPASSSPQVGSVAVWGAGGAYSGVGHVGVVTTVDSGGKGYWVSEMNYLSVNGNSVGVVDVRHVSYPDPYLLGWIPQSVPSGG